MVLPIDALIERQNLGLQSGRAASLVVAAVFLIGVGYCAMLPPFEGFDEYAHYSSIRQIADSGTLPIFGRSFIDQTVLDYKKRGPTPWSSGEPPFEQPGHMTYPRFFANPEATANYEFYRSDSANKHFTPGADANLEAQHPPLYYLMMAPIMRSTEGLSFVNQILVLRLASYLLAWIGFVFGWRATQSYAGKPIPQGVATAYVFFPFVVPMFFSEFARMGNDSLCLFILGGVYSLSLAVFYRNDGGVKESVMLGVLLGFGLLTKALFLPVVAGYTLFIALRAWRRRRKYGMLRGQLSILALTIIPALMIGGGWYVYDFIAFGSPTGSFEAILLEQHGGLLSNLLPRFSVYAVTRDVIGIAVSWSWAGSWSLVRTSPLLQFLLLLITFWIVANYFLCAKCYGLDDPIWLPLWLLVPFVGGLFYHVLVVIARGTSGTPGWYLNILAPFLASAMGYGLERVRMTAVGRFLLIPTSAYCLLFLLVVLWSQAALFAGCAVKSEQKYYQFSGSLFCLDQISEVISHLSILGWPLLAAFSIGIGFLCVSAGLFSLIREQRKVVQF